MQKNEYIIGLDGGGTKSVACLVNNGGNVLAYGQTGATNYKKDQEKLILQRMQDIVLELKNKAKIAPNATITLSVGLSGLGTDALCEHMVNLLRHTHCADKVFAASDVATALQGAFAGEPGAILIAGTGSIAYGKAQDGHIFRVGGWGYLVGDEGAGFDIGRRGIIAALADWDGRGEKTILRPRLEENFHVESINLAVPEIYVNHTTRGALAKFAPFVFTAAREGDRVACGIIKNAALALAEHVIALAPRLGGKNKIQLALLGNIFKSKDILLPVMEEKWNSAHCLVEIKPPLFPAEIGAVLLTKDDEKNENMFIKNLQKSLTKF